MEVFFLDVGQGTCQVILLGQRRAIVIDCGIRRDRIVLQFLKKTGIDYLERLIVSHSHEDHMGGAVALLGEYQNRIGKICFVQDHMFLTTVFWNRISALLKTRKLTPDQLIRLEVSEGPQEVWTDLERSFRLRTYSPSAGENLAAQEAKTPNATSAVLFLDARDHNIVFAADSGVAQWREINRKKGCRIKCDILSVPHHAGRTHDCPEEIEWQFEKALDVAIAVISVGTSNTHNHPRNDVVNAMVNRGTKILCTQITGACNSNLESLRPGVLRPQLHFGRSSAVSDRTKKGRSRNVACAGTIRVELSDEGFLVDRLDDHKTAVDQLLHKEHGCPLCRRETVDEL